MDDFDLEYQQYRDELDAQYAREEANAMRLAEARWVDNGCSNHYHEDLI